MADRAGEVTEKAREMTVETGKKVRARLGTKS
jgi:hypothetical protein